MEKLYSRGVSDDVKFLIIFDINYGNRRNVHSWPYTTVQLRILPAEWKNAKNGRYL